jgi:hypothetical protein
VVYETYLNIAKTAKLSIIRKTGDLKILSKRERTKIKLLVIITSSIAMHVIILETVFNESLKYNVLSHMPSLSSPGSKSYIDTFPMPSEIGTIMFNVPFVIDRAVNKSNNKITELRAIFQRESQNS